MNVYIYRLCTGLFIKPKFQIDVGKYINYVTKNDSNDNLNYKIVIRFQ